jgi:hypothetical protein
MGLFSAIEVNYLWTKIKLFPNLRKFSSLRKDSLNGSVASERVVRL